MVASGQFKQADTPARAPGGGMAPVVQARAVGPLQGSGVAVASPAGAPAVAEGGGFNSGLMSLLADPAIRARLNLSSPAQKVESMGPEKQTVAPLPSPPVQNTLNQNFLRSPEYQTAYNSYLNRLSNPPQVISPYQAFVNARMEREESENRPYVNPFRRPA